MLTVEVITESVRLEALRTEWEALLTRSEHSEPTVSPAWLLPWWKIYGPHEGRSLRVVVFRHDTRLVGLAPLLLRVHRYRSGLRFRRLEWLASGEADGEEIGSDYLGAIVERGEEERVARTLADALVNASLGPWDELVLTAMRGDGVFPYYLTEALRGHGIHACLEVIGMCPYIPLPRCWEDYLASLSSSRRYLVRKSLRDFEAWAGDGVRFERAAAREDLYRAKRILTTLHRERWSGTGKSGVFVHPRYCAFHDTAMEQLLDSGRLELLWVAVGGEPVAALYNLVGRDGIRFYQSGRRPGLPREIRVGIVMHAYAIRAAIEAGRKEYDFLAGLSRYKMELALAIRPIVQLRAARSSVVETLRRATEFLFDQGRAIRDYVRNTVGKREGR